MVEGRTVGVTVVDVAMEGIPIVLLVALLNECMDFVCMQHDVLLPTAQLCRGEGLSELLDACENEDQDIGKLNGWLGFVSERWYVKRVGDRLIGQAKSNHATITPHHRLSFAHPPLRVSSHRHRPVTSARLETMRIQRRP